jgi:hypothetical protein
MHLIGLAAFVLWPTYASAQIRCDGDLCGVRLMEKGWQKLAACDGHAWSYLLGKGDKVLSCLGISGAAGPFEKPCREFRGDVEKYRMLAAKPRDDCWSLVENAGGGN